MRRVKMFLLIMTMSLSLLGGCGTSNQADVLTVALGGQITSLDPAMADDTYSMIVIQNMYRTLFKFNEDGSLRNDLCASYEVSDDKLTYTFKIKDANWSDGKKVSADDFVYGIKRGLTYGVENAWHAQDGRLYIVGAQDAFDKDLKVDQMDAVGVKTIDDQTFSITLNQPVLYFDKLLTGGIYTPLRKDIAKEKESMWSLETDVVVNGPYKPVSIVPADSVELEKNDEYYLVDEVTLAKIKVQVMEDSASQLQAYNAQEIDFATFVANEGYKNYEGKKDLYKVDPYVANYFLDINSLSNSNPALQNVEIRKAMAMAINRDEIKQVIGTGDYATALHGLVPRGIQGASKDFREEGDEMGNNLPYDVTKAKSLMEKNGYSSDNLLTISFKTTGQQLHSDIAQILQSQLKEIYINLEINKVEQGVFYSQVDGGDFEMARYGLSATTLDPYAAYLVMWRKASMQALVFDDDTFENYMEQAAQELDANKRMELLHAGENYLINEQAYFIPLITNTTVMLLNPSIKGIERTPAAMFYFEHVEL